MKEVIFIEDKKFELSNDLRVIAGTVEFEKDKYLAALEEMVSKYQGIIVTEETVKAGKKEVAGLRAFKKQIDDFRKEQEKIYTKPFDVFKKDVKELTSKIDEATKILTDQLDSFEEERKNKKRDEIHKVELELLEQYGFCEDYPFEWGNDFLNATKKIKDIRAELEEQLINTIKENKEAEEKQKLLQEKKEMLEMILETMQDKYQLKNKVRYTEIEYLLETSTTEIKESLEVIFQERKELEKQFEEKEVTEVADQSIRTKDYTIQIFGITSKQARALDKFLKENDIKFEVR